MKRLSSLRFMEWPMQLISGEVFWITSLTLRSFRHLPGCVLDGLHDVLVSVAAAQVAGNAPADFVFTGAGVLLQQRTRRQDHAGRAVTALQTVLFLEPF